MKSLLLIVLVPIFALTARAQSPQSEYFLPSSGQMEAPAVLPLSAMSVTTDSSGLRTIHFHLPEDLLGPDFEATSLLEQPSTQADPSFVQFTDGTIAASCVAGTFFFNCVLSYPSDYVTNESGGIPKDFLAAKYASNPLALQSALLSAQAFRVDPEGSILIYF